jgi:hypothetical protein
MRGVMREFFVDLRFEDGRNLFDMSRETTKRSLIVDARTAAMQNALGDDEANVLAAVAGVKGAVLSAIAALPPPGEVTPEQIDDLATQLKQGLGEEVADEVGRRLVTEGTPS